MIKITRLFPLLILLSLLAGSLHPAPAAQSESWESKVDPWVMETVARGETEFILYLNEQADLSGSAALQTKQEKGAYVFERLTEVARRSQPALTAALDRRGLQYRPYWIVNMIWVRGKAADVQALAGRPDVAHVYANPWVKLDEPASALPLDIPSSPATPDAVEWNITKVQAPQVWAAGYTGQGAVVGGQDTGYQWDHPALKNQYRGWSGMIANHNYNWHDAIHEDNPNSGGPNSCGFNSLVPCDDHYHGTHTMGTMVGDDGSANQIGMAPGARWIGCRNMENGWGTPITYGECYEWFLAPTDLNSENPRPDLAPDVINNSWGCPPDEGCTQPDVLLQAVQAIRAAGIVTVHSAGNEGSGCSTVQTPAAIYAESFTVGNTTSSDTIASSSSRGPVTVDGSNRLKPDISAPGTGIRSSIPGGYTNLSGTSMSGPHVAGLVALMISGQPALAGQVDTIETLIEQTAVHLTTAQTCGGTANQVPNNVFGWGRIDALGAFQGHLLEISKTASASQVAPGDILTYTLTVTHTAVTDPTENVVVSDQIPEGATFISATLPHSLDGNTITWSIPSLDPLEVRELTLVVQIDVSASGVLSNENYSVQSDDAGPVTGEPVHTTVVPYALALSKIAPETVTPGGVITYTLTVTNLHPWSAAYHLVLTDTLPQGVTFITATQPYTLSEGTVQWSFAGLGPSEIRSVALEVGVPMTASGVITNQEYGLSADQIPLLLGPPVQTTVDSFAMDLHKVAAAHTWAGEALTYTLTVTNLHPFAAADNLVLTDSLPLNTSFVDASLPFTLEADKVTWTLPSLGPQQTWTVELVVRAPLTFTGEIVNQDYTLLSDQTPLQAGEPVTTRIHALALEKTASALELLPGELLTYTLMVTNQHPVSSTHHLVLSDSLPDTASFVSATAPYTQTGNVVTWELESLAPGESWTVQLVVQAPQTEGALVNLDYTVRSDEVTVPIQGEAVTTLIRWLKNYFPLLLKGPA